ncbi:MAG: bifunctional 4-hydroxy-2-oxoglutarate aldolase/2-dehydro-3-deoxy-phosphogluconate aldolase [Treponema sp.]|nr:bifunctional 4-hydroxy-2-oxoglutarate aldolase/2-dehydro-3-deoxy-phosphogluconate aldolase [Treponema sp.]
MFESEYEFLRKTKIVPVVALNSEDDAVPLANALISGGIHAMEITFRDPSNFSKTANAIKSVNKNVPDMTVGAGTVVNANLAKMAIDAGAKFIVSPGFSKDVVSFCIDKKIVCYPGVASASEIMNALSFNLKVLKLFPAEILGGVAIIKAFSGPFPNVSFLPSGGINEKNALSYYSLSNVAAISGSWMVSKEILLQKDWNRVTELSKNIVDELSK